MTKRVRKAVAVVILFLVLGGMAGAAQGAYGQIYPATRYGADLKERLNFTDTEGHWAQEAIVRQAALGILDGRESNLFSPEDSALRIEVVQAILRLLGLEAEALRAAPAAEPTQVYLQAAQQAGVITPREATELDWQEGARRQEAAAWLARALGVEPVATPQLVRSFRDWPQVAGEYLGEVEALLARGYIQGVSPGLLAPNQVMKRGELAVLLDSVADEFLPSLGIRVGRGQVIDSEGFIMNGQGWGERLYHVVTAEGAWVGFLTAEYQTSGVNAGHLVVRRGDRVGGSELLQFGDLIRYYLLRDEVLLVEVLTSPTSLLAGRIEDIDPAGGWLDFITPQGQRSRFYIEPGIEISLNGYPAQVEDLFVGQEANLEVQDGRIVGLTAFLPEGEGGTLAPGARVRTGRVHYLQGDTLVILREGKEESYQLVPETVIVRSGSRLQAEDLRPGDRVTLYFNDLEEDIPLRVLVEGERRRVRELYRGTISLVSPFSREIVLNQPERFNMTVWEPLSSSLRLELDPEVQIYAGRQSLTPRELAAGFTGEEVYVAVQTGYGREQAVRLVVKSGFSREYYGEIEDVDWVAGEIELERAYLQYGPGTIFLWEERLIEPTVLERGQEVLVLAASPGNGPVEALVVSVEDVREPQLDIYWGELENIGFNYLEMDHICSLDDHRWREWRRSTSLDLRLNQDTLFWDNTAEEGTNNPLSKGEFAERRSQEDYEDTTVLVLAQGEETVALGFWPEDTDYSERVTVGRIRSIDGDTGVITLERVKDWNNVSREWRLYPGMLEVDAREAVTVRGERGISWSELQPGDNLYLIREGMKGRLILVQ